MPILGTDAYRFALGSELGSAGKSVSLVSAFITVPGIEWVLSHLSPTVTSLRVLTRWDCWDLVVGASDLEVYPLLHARGAHFYILPDLHAKIVLIDDRILFLGSANVTNSGLRLVPGGNREIGITIVPAAEDMKVINTLFDEAVELSPELFDEFRIHVADLKRVGPPQIKPSWPTELLKRLVRRPARLWVAELIWTESPSKLMSSELSGVDGSARQHDLALLGLERDSLEPLAEVDLKETFLRSRACQWLLARLLVRDSHELYFGELTALLHDALLDDPKPYRQDVKTLALNLITWTDEMIPTVSVDRPKHSQRLRLNPS